MLTKNLAGLRDALIVLAKAQLEEDGDFDPRALVKTADGDVTLIESLGSIADDVPKGLRASQLRRYVEDNIRKMRETHEITSVAILSDAILRPQEGGPGTTAMIGFFEERPGPLLLVITHYEIRDGHVHLGDVTITEREGHLVSSGPPA
jgi:hypothetical protein